MKDIFNRRQRFSLRKYSFGVASVLLGTALFAAHTAQADEVVASDASSSNPGSSVEGESSSELVETNTASTAQADPTAVVSSTEATASTFNLTPEASTTDKVATETTDNKLQKLRNQKLLNQLQRLQSQQKKLLQKQLSQLQ